MSADGQTDVLRTGEAGGLVIRGGVLRGAGYGAGIVLGAATSVLLLRHLGVESFGRYGIVVALVGIVSAVTDAGLTAIGSRELAVLPRAERPPLLANLLGLRIVLTAAGVLAATAFAAVAGYPGVVIAGTALAGLGVLLLNTQSTAMMPLAVELRLGSITLIETLRHALTLVGVAVLVLAGATLLPFFTVQVAVGAVVLLLTPALLGSSGSLRPRLDRSRVRALLRESLPIAAAIAMNVIYLRLLVVLVSVQTDDRETGLFATAFRIFEILLGIPTLVLAVALPLLAVAGAEDRQRLRYALQRLTETAVAVSLLLVLVTIVLAERAIVLLGGEDYRDAAPILRLLAFALLGIFVSQVLTLGLVSLRRQRDVALANGVALVLLIALGIVLVESSEGTGAAAAAVATESVLALLLLGLLARSNPEAVPRVGLVPRIVAAAAAGAVVALLPLSAWLAAPLAVAAFLAAGFALRAFPPEVAAALRGRKAR